MKMDIYKFYGYVGWLRYIWWLLVLNTAMVLTNLPFLFCACFLELGLPSLPAFLLTGLTIGPSVLAAFQSLPDIENGVWSSYFRHFKEDWKKAARFWTPVWAVLVLLFADVIILETIQTMEPLKWICIALLCLFGTYLLAFFLVWAEWSQPVKDAAALTAKLALVKPLQYNLNFLILLGTVILLALKPIYLALYGAALTLFLVRLNFTPVVKFVQERPENQPPAS